MLVRPQPRLNTKQSKSSTLFQKKKSILLQDAEASAATEDTPAETQPINEANVVTTTATGGQIDSNLATNTENTYNDATKTSQEIADLYKTLNTQWSSLKSAYESNKALLVEKNEAYNTQTDRIYDPKIFKFNMNKTCGSLDLFDKFGAKYGTAYIEELTVTSNDPVGDCMRYTDPQGRMCIGYDDNKIYGLATSCNVPDALAPTGEVQFNISSESVYKALASQQAQQEPLAEAQAKLDKHTSVFNELKEKQTFQVDMKDNDSRTTQALENNRKLMKEKSDEYAVQKNNSQDKFNEYSNQMANSIAESREGIATFTEKLKAEQAIFDTATLKSGEFAASKSQIEGRMNRLRSEIDQFMAVEKIVPTTEKFVMTSDVKDLQAINSLESISGNWSKFTNLMKTHTTNVKNMEEKIRSMQSTISGDTTNIDEVKSKIWSKDAEAETLVPAEYVNAQVYYNTLGSGDQNSGSCTLRLGTRGFQPGVCEAELIDEDGVRITLGEGLHKGIKYKKNSQIVLKKDGKVVNDLATDCGIALESGGNIYYAGNISFEDVNRNMPLATNYDSQSPERWEDKTDNIRVFSASQNGVHAMNLHQNGGKLFDLLNNCGDDCENVAKNACLEAGADCVGIFKDENNKFGLLSQSGGFVDYYKDAAGVKQQCFGNADSAVNAGKQDSGLTVQALMKSHYADFLKMGEYIDRSLLYQSKAVAMVRDIESRNQRWTDATAATIEQVTAQQGLLEKAQEDFDLKTKEMESLTAAYKQSQQTYKTTAEQEKNQFTTVASERSQLMNNDTEFKTNIKHVFNHPLWQTFKELGAQPAAGSA